MSDFPHCPTCDAVTFDMRGEGYGAFSYHDAAVGDLLWNPKMGEGHVLVADLRCGSLVGDRRVDCGCAGWGSQPCPSMTLVCQCGEDGSWRDHHYVMLARRSRQP